MTVTVRYDGEGVFQDTDKASKTSAFEGGLVPNGGTFETSKQRLAQLTEQGIQLSEVTDAAPADTKAQGAKEKS